MKDMIGQMKDQGTRFSDFQAKTELLLFLKKINESPQFSDKFRTQALLHSSSLDLGKRSRLQSSEKVEPAIETKGKPKSSSSSTASKEKLLKTFQRGKSQDDEDDDFDDMDDTEEENSDPKSRRDNSVWLPTQIKKLKQVMLKFGLSDIDKVYEKMPSLQKTKSIEQCREMRFCLYYQTLENASSNSAADLDKHYQFLKKVISKDSALIEDFKTLKYGYTTKVTRKKEGSISIVEPNQTSFGPGDSIHVEVTLGSTVFEQDVAVYFEVVGKSLNFGSKETQVRTFFSRLDPELSTANLIINAPGCPGEYIMKCVKMWSKEEKDYTHFVCSEPFPFTVHCSESIQEAIPNAVRGTNQLLQRITFMRNLQVFLTDDLLSSVKVAVAPVSLIISFFYKIIYRLLLANMVVE